MRYLKRLLSYFLAQVLRLWTAVSVAFKSGHGIPRAPENLLRFLFNNRRLEILEFLTDVYYRYGTFRYEDKIYVLDPKVSMKVISKLDKGAHNYLDNSPLNTSFLGATDRSPDTRHVIAALFRKANMEQKGRLMVDVIRNTVKKMESMDVVNLSEISLKMALDIVGTVLLDLDLGAIEGKQDKLLDAIMTILHRSYALGEVDPRSLEFQEASAALDKGAREILTQALEKSPAEKSLPHLLHEARGFDEAVDNLKLFLMAGSETTASSIPVLLYLMSALPNLQRELQDEADEFVAKLTHDASCTPPKLESATKELLRTYAIAPYISRKTHEQLEMGQVTFPANSDLRIFTWGIHRSPDLWNNSKQFRPTRFLQDDSQARHQSYSWIPFGAGSRICIGQHLAWVEMRLAMTYLLHHFTFKRVSQTRDLDFCVDWEHAVVHPDRDVLLGVTKRQP